MARLTCLLLAALVVAAATWSQEDSPHVGYAYPAGGQQETTFEVLLGGQHLDGATTAYVSGGGVQGQAIDYIRPLNQGQFKEMQNRMGELARKKEEAGEGEWTEEEEQQLAELRARLSDFAIRRMSVPALVETVTLQVTVAADAEPGERELRLWTELGLTNPVVFCVGQLPESVEKSGRSIAENVSEQRGGRGRKSQADTTPDPGTTPVAANTQTVKPITPPAIANGQILPGDTDRYVFSARQGQQLVIDVSARRLIPYLADAVPGWFQATVTLSHADGGEVAYADDFRFHPDPVLHCEIPEDGEYVVEIKDALYRGREDFVYRMAIGELPYVTGVFPLGAQAGTETSIELAGWNLPETQMLQGALEPGMHPIRAHSGEVVSNQVPFVVDGLPGCAEVEPNNDVAGAQGVPFPAAINGRIDAPGDVDEFRIECAPGGRVVAEVQARRLGSPVDSLLRLMTSQGEQLAFSDDWEDRAAGLTTHHADSRLSATAPADGVCYLHLSDTQGRGGPECTYRLRVDAERPGFKLRVVPSSLNARAGTTVPLTVHALRTDGFGGEVTLALSDAPEGFVLSGGLVPAGQDMVRATLTVPAATMDEPVSLSVEGRATIAGREVTATAVPAEDMMQAFVYRHLVPMRELLVAVIGRPRDFPVSLACAEPVLIPLGGTARVPVGVAPTCFFGAVELALSEPPKGISIQSATLDRRAGEMVLVSNGAEVEPGLTGNLIVQAFGVRTTEDTGQGKEQRKKRRILLTTLPAIPFRIAEE